MTLEKQPQPLGLVSSFVPTSYVHSEHEMRYYKQANTMPAGQQLCSSGRSSIRSVVRAVAHSAKGCRVLPLPSSGRSSEGTAVRKTRRARTRPHGPDDQARNSPRPPSRPHPPSPTPLLLGWARRAPGWWVVAGQSQLHGAGGSLRSLLIFGATITSHTPSL